MSEFCGLWKFKNNSVCTKRVSGQNVKLDTKCQAENDDYRWGWELMSLCEQHADVII